MQCVSVFERENGKEGAGRNTDSLTERRSHRLEAAFRRNGFLVSHRSLLPESQ